jgi:hypothetical protein
MKELLLATLLTTFFTTAFAQPPKWYLSVSSGAGWGGPKGSIKSKFEKTGFNNTSSFNIIGIGGSTQYPVVYSGLPLLVRAGKRLKGAKSIFLIAGTSAAAEVSGYKKEGSFSGFIGGTLGTHIFIRYKVMQVTAGMEHTMPKSRLKLGYAPSAFLLRYSNVPGGLESKKTTSVVPGLALTGRLPLGKEKRRVGVELVADVNVAPSATIKEQYKTMTDDNGSSKEVQVLSATKVSMVHGMAGLALTFRKK